MKSSNPTPPSPNDPAARLAALLTTNKFIPFHVDVPDKEFSYIRLSIYGATETNELFVKLTNGKTTFVDVVDSPLISPAMGDRIFGMDSSDTDVAFALVNQMWDDHQGALVKR